MTLPRTTIRDAVVAALKAANTAAGSRVYPSRLRPLRSTDYPCLLVYTRREVENLYSKDDDHLAVLQFVVQACTTGNEGETMEKAVDALCEDVRAVMLDDAALAANWLGINSMTTEIEVPDFLVDPDRPQAAKPVVEAIMTFDLEHIVS